MTRFNSTIYHFFYSDGIIRFLKLLKLFVSLFQKSTSENIICQFQRVQRMSHYTQEPPTKHFCTFIQFKPHKQSFNQFFLFGRWILSWQFAVYASHVNVVSYALPYVSTLKSCDPFYLIPVAN